MFRESNIVSWFRGWIDWRGKYSDSLMVTLSVKCFTSEKRTDLTSYIVYKKKDQYKLYEQKYTWDFVVEWLERAIPYCDCADGLIGEVTTRIRLVTLI